MQSVIPKRILLLAASTGGPGQIQKIIQELPQLHNSSVIIALHMVEGFILSYASRLEKSIKNKMNVVQDKQNFEKGHIYVAHGKTYLDSDTNIFHYAKASKDSYNPDIDTLFSSFSHLTYKSEMLVVILTGIGSDGVDAAVQLQSLGAKCITESAQSAIVDGMPNKARSSVKNIGIYEIDEIIKICKEFCDV